MTQVVSIDTLSALSGIPGRALDGSDKSMISVHNAFRIYTAQRFLSLIHESFWMRTIEGESDQVGESWVPLQKKTKAIKRNMYRREMRNAMNDDDVPQPQLTGNFTSPRQLSAKQTKLYNIAYGVRALKGGTIRGNSAKSLAGIKRDENYNEDQTPINVRTGRLAGSLLPGRISNNRMYSGPDQIIEMDGANFSFESTVPYYDKIDNGDAATNLPPRPIITEEHEQQFLQIALAFGLQAAKDEYNRILTNRNRD